jgi:hypothetical protein
MFTKNTVKIVFIAIIALSLSGFTYAFAAANTVPDTYAGDGQGTISGYVVSAIHYTLDATDPSKINTVDFTLDHAATLVKVKLVAAGTTYYGCTITGGTSVSCTVGGAVTVLAADQLRVIASN